MGVSAWNRTKIVLSLLLSLMFLMAAGCAQTTDEDRTESDTADGQPVENDAAAADDDKHVTFMFSFKVGSLDPHNDMTPLRGGVTETLVKLDEDLNIEGWLATDWEAIDETTWQFTLQEGVTFHDGTEMDAEAVKASFERGIEESEPLASALQIESMDADGHVLTIETTEPHPALPSELVNPYASVISVAAEEEMGPEAFNNAPVGTGPFKVAAFSPDIEVQLERNDDYWDGEPNLESASIKFNEDANVRSLALQSGEVDIAYNLPAESLVAIEQEEDLNIESVPGLRVHFIMFNQQHSLLEDERIRRAVDLLLNRQSIAEDIMLGHAVRANGPFNSDLPFGSTDAVGEQNIEQAKALLAEAGYEEAPDGQMTKDGEPLALELITYEGRPELPLIAQLLQSDAAQAGIQFDIKTVEDPDSYLQDNGDWHLATYSTLSAPRGDGGFFLNAALAPEGFLNQGQVDSQDLNDVIAELNAESDETKRVQLTQDAVDIITEDVLHSYAVYPNIIIGVNERVENWFPGGEEYYILTHTMDVK